MCRADAVVCLCAGITATDGVPVGTVVDNRLLGEPGTQALTTGRGWAQLEGHGGWVLPHGTGDLRALREDRTGAWSDINTTSATERRTRRYQTLWLDHGTDPVGASYTYLLMPGASRRTVAARAAGPGRLRVLDNTADRQAIAVPSLGMAAANFWQAGTVGPLTVTAPASVLVRRRRSVLDLRVSEPPRTGQPLELVWRGPVRRGLAHDPSVEVLATGASLRPRITPGTAGAAHRCEVLL